MTFWLDLRYALRSLSRNPRFTMISVLTLMFGIGACTAVFSVVYAVMLRPLPYSSPDRLCVLWKSVPEKGLWLWQGGLDPFGIFIWHHPLTYISSKIIQRVLNIFVGKHPLNLGSKRNSTDQRDFIM